MQVMYGSIPLVTIPPGNPRDKSDPSGPGVGKARSRLDMGVPSGGKSESNLSFSL